MSESDPTPIGEYDVVVTHTAKSKAYRYLAVHDIERHVRDPWQLYYDATNESYLARTDRTVRQTNLGATLGDAAPRDERIVLILDVHHDREEIVVVSQTRDHYTWSDYDSVTSIAHTRGDGDA